jgi:hypothetical protein
MKTRSVAEQLASLYNKVIYLRGFCGSGVGGAIVRPQIE